MRGELGSQGIVKTGLHEPRVPPLHQISSDVRRGAGLVLLVAAHMPCLRRPTRSAYPWRRSIRDLADAADSRSRSGFTRGFLAVPLFLGYSFVVLMTGGSGGLGGVALMALGAVAAGYLVGSAWALLIALPFALYGVLALDDPGPLENTDSGWGILILLAMALPVAIAAGARVMLRARAGSGGSAPRASRAQRW